MKNKLLLVILLTAIAIIPINGKAISFVSEITGSKKVEVGKTIQLKMEYIIGNDECLNIENCNTGENSRQDITTQSEWTSSNIDVATVDQNGVVTGKKVGKVTIIANGGDPARDASYEIEVVAPNTAVEPTPSETPKADTPKPEPRKTETNTELTKPEVSNNQTNNKDGLVKVPNTLAGVPLYVVIMGTVLLVMSLTTIIYINHPNKKK